MRQFVLSLLTATTLLGQQGQNLDQLIEDFDNTIRAHTQKLMAAKTNEERTALSGQFPTPEKLAPTILGILQSTPDETTAVKALSWLIARCTNLPEGRTAMQLLHDKYAGSKGLLELLDFLAHTQATVAEPLLRKIRDINPNIEEKAAATYGLALILFAQGEGNPQAADKLAEATQLFTEMVTVYKDVVARGFKLSDQAAAYLFELENIQPGKPAPEIEGKDVSGSPFKLSDYRGKTVVVVFWGSWCHACHTVLDEVAKVTSAFGDRTVMLGVNTDPLDTLKQQNVSWRNWADEFNRGPISAMWNIRHWPTIFVIDRDGVLRGKDVSGPALQQLLTSLNP